MNINGLLLSTALAASSTSHDKAFLTSKTNDIIIAALAPALLFSTSDEPSKSQLSTWLCEMRLVQRIKGLLSDTKSCLQTQGIAGSQEERRFISQMSTLSEFILDLDQRRLDLSNVDNGTQRTREAAEVVDSDAENFKYDIISSLGLTDPPSSSETY